MRYSKINIDLFQTSNAFRFKNKKRLKHYLYLKKKQKIISQILNTVIFFEESTANESRFSNTCNRIYKCQNDDFETIKKKHFFEDVNSIH
jgi:hypothetical protein